MHEDDGLLAHAEDAYQVAIDDVVHYIVSSISITLFSDTVEGALEWGRSEASVKCECATLRGPYELCHVVVIRKRSRETNQSDRLLLLESSGQRPRDQALQHETSLVVEQVDFIDNHAVHKAHHSICLSRHYIPLLWSGDNDMGFRDFLLGDAHITSEFFDADIEIGEGSSELAHDLSCQSFEWCYVYYPELFLLHAESLRVGLGCSL